MSQAEISALVEYFGGYEMLARILNVTVEDLRRWADGQGRPPSEVFSRLAELRSVLTAYPARGAA